MTGWASTLRWPAEVALAGGVIYSGEIHVLPRAERHMGPETPVDMLNRAEGFFALSVREGGALLVAKAHVLFVAVPSEPPEPPMDDPERASAAQTMQLRFELSDGSTCEGQVSLEPPPARERPLDFLNLAPGFFSVWSPDAVRLINRTHIRTVLVLT